MSENIATTDQTHELDQRWKIWRTEKQKRLLEDNDKGISSIAVFDNLSKLISNDAVISVDVGNNADLGKISKEQRSRGFEKFAADLHNPDFAEFANGCRALGSKITRKEDLEARMKKILEHEGTALLEIVTDVKLV